MAAVERVEVMSQEEGAMKIRSKVLNEAVGMVVHAAAKRLERPILAAILFEGDARGFRLVAADNYRIAIRSLTTDEDWSELGRVPVDVTDIPALQKFLAISDRDVTLTRTLSCLRFADDSRAIEVRVVDGTYPDYASIVKLNGGEAVAVNAAYLVDAAKAQPKGFPFVIRTSSESGAPVVVSGASGDLVEAIMPIRVGAPDLHDNRIAEVLGETVKGEAAAIA